MDEIGVRAIPGCNFAVEITGVSAWTDLSAAQIEQMRTFWQDWPILLFRRQALSEAELVKFTSAFGKVEVIVREDWASTNMPEVSHISNLKYADGSTVGRPGSGELVWHTDQSYMPRPATGAVLYGVEVPPTGAHTYWADLRAAYDDLPERLKSRIDGRRAIFSYSKRVSTYENPETTPEEIHRKTPDVTHPIVLKHPVNGRRSLYLDPAALAGIEGMEPAEGIALVDEIVRHATQPQFVYQHHWQVGDLVMWDNGCVIHRRDAFYPKQRRFLKRTAMQLPADRHVIPSAPESLITA